MNLENMVRDIWYGDIPNDRIENLKSKLKDVTTEKESFLLINKLLKLGDFSVKGLLIQLMNSTQDEVILNLCTRLFCSIATHDDYYERSIEELGEIYFELVKNCDATKYYYHNDLSFSGDLVKKLIPRVMVSLRDKKTFDMVTIPSILSIWSGIKSPVQYGAIITDEKYRELMLYIDSLTKKEWKIGEKYFYGHLVV
ncbi:hypothetical protein COL32_16635 [Bacillus pseudomycoides]|uniref:Imm47 family immunity protein n=1 Tax=Bacillus pseudomycoides TaxID=64104 RepID=UPI000BF43CF9|nr:Imm47 family immunity protein [Bacillus pseudomycoides]PFW95733.1 hypothetical protein COL29_08940 [Bacillus pseudomycoides]PFX42085.1 hypothetical protein COL32_16635 [Bacillus pseudomycoides]